MAESSANIENRNPWDRTKGGLLAFLGVLVGGTLAYRALGLSWVEAYYQTVITVSTVGYTEVGSDISNTYRLVSSIVILFGTGVALYTLGVTFDALMEGQFRAQLGRNRMERAIEELQDHIVVCGAGQVGQAIVATVLQQGDDVVVIDTSPDEIDLDHLPGAYLVAGDATDDLVLLKAGVDRARGLIIALDSDAANLYVTLSASQINTDLHIVSRANESSAKAKLLRAGAHRVVNPHEIGGNRMASLVLQPNVADFLGESMTDEDLQFRMSELPVTTAAQLADRTLAECGLVDATGVTLLAVRRPDGSFVHNPSGGYALTEGDVLIALGTPEQQHALTAWMAGRTA